MVNNDKQQYFQITGMDCASCAQTIQNGVSQLGEVESCTLNFATERLRVSGGVSQQAIIQRVQQLGYQAIPLADDTPQLAQTMPVSGSFWRYMWQRRDTRLALFAAILMLPGLLFEEILAFSHPLIHICSIMALLLAGFPVARAAWRAITISREININVLMTIAAVGAVIIGAYTEAGMVMVLFAFGEALEGYTANRARDAIRGLMQVMPNQATRLTAAGEMQVAVTELQVGDIIVVKPGERIPMDGWVQAGASSVNQAPITGESKLIEKQVGAQVFASSINGEGVLEIEVSHLAADNTISRLIKMVEEAQEKRAPSQRFIDRFAHYYTPAVVMLALIVATVPPLLFGQPFWNPNPETFGWLYRALALLVVACPCALVISTPVSIISAISNAAEQGVLVKGGAFLEMLNRVKAIAFDKTGTLTGGKPTVVSLRSVQCQEVSEDGIGICLDCNEVLALASAVERRSEHPVAQAITSQATRHGLQQRYPAAEDVRAITGKGVTGQVNGQSVLVGSHTYFDATIPHTEQDCQLADAEAQQGFTPLMVSQNERYLGMITVADTVRESSKEAVAMLKQAGIEHIVMLTGDNQTVAELIAAETGVTDVRHSLLPADKVAAVQQLQQLYGPVAMVGDGINDAPALASADVGLAIGAASGQTTQAMETADITLMSDNLGKLPFVFGLSRATMQTIYLNVLVSIGIKVIFLILVLFGLSTMWMAVLADTGTALLVTLNGMRLLRYKAET